MARPKRPRRYHPLPAGTWHIATRARYSSGSPHWAYDYGAPFGTPIRAPRDGYIGLVRDGEPDFAGPKPGRPGNMLVLQWTGDKGEKRALFFNHLQKGSVKVKTGQKVKAGQHLARVGSSGNSTGPHLHLAGLRYWPTWVNLYNYMSSPSLRIWPPNRVWRGPLGRWRERLESWHNRRR